VERWREKSREEQEKGKGMQSFRGSILALLFPTSSPVIVTNF